MKPEITRVPSYCLKLYSPDCNGGGQKTISVSAEGGLTYWGSKSSEAQFCKEIAGTDFQQLKCHIQGTPVECGDCIYNYIETGNSDCPKKLIGLSGAIHHQGNSSTCHVFGIYEVSTAAIIILVLACLLLYQTAQPESGPLRKWALALLILLSASQILTLLYHC